MLIFPRKPTEKIMVGDDIIISIVSIKKDEVKFALDAPQHILDSVNKEDEIYRKSLFPHNGFRRNQKRRTKGGLKRKL